MNSHAEKVELLQRLEDARVLLVVHGVMRESESRRMRMTFGKHAGPAIESAYATGKVPLLLPAFTGAE